MAAQLAENLPGPNVSPPLDVGGQSRLDDVESQVSSGGSTGSGDGMHSEHVGVAMTEVDKQRWEAMAGTRAIPLRGRARHHHPLLAASRCVLEREACEAALQFEGALVVDVGGAPHRTHATLGKRGRYVCPVLQRGDTFRRRRVPPDAIGQTCAHRYEDCRCHDDKARVLLFCHSAYYFEPLVLWNLCSANGVVDVLVVEHRFGDVHGGFYDEATYITEGRVVTMDVTGNTDPYVHPLTPWCMGWRGPCGEAFSASLVREIGKFTYLTRLEPCRSSVPRPILDLQQVVDGEHLSGPVQFSAAARNAVADNAKLTNVELDMHGVECFGPIVFTTAMVRGRQVKVTLPRTWVHQLALLAVNRARDHLLYAELSYAATTKLRRTRIPAGKLAEVATVAVALAFVVNLQNEVDALNTIQTKFGWQFTAHKTLLTFGGFATRNWVSLACCVLVLLVIWATFEGLDQETDERIYGALGFVVLLFLGGCCCTGSIGAVRRYRAWQLGNWSASYRSPDDPRVPLLGDFAFERRVDLPGSDWVKPVPPRADWSGEARVVDQERDKQRDVDRLFVSGIVLDGAMSNTLRPSAEAELSAVTNRILAPKDNPTPAALIRLKEGFSDPVFQFSVPLDLTYNGARAWARKLKATYPMVYIERLLVAWKEGQGIEADPIPTEAFLKLEKAAAAVTIEGQKPVKPRLIQPPQDVDKAMLGPFCTQVFGAAVRAWDGVQSPVMYCAKWTSDQVGAAVDAFIASCGGEANVIGYNSDMSGYDATLGIEVQSVAFEAFYVRLGMPRWMLSWLTRVRTRGRTPNGVVYYPERCYGPWDSWEEAEDYAEAFREFKLRSRVQQDPTDGTYWVLIEDFQMASGRQDTNLLDTVLLVASMVPCLKGKHYLLLVCGDDAFLLLQRGDESVVEDIQAFQKALGFKPEGKLCLGGRHEWEFCSRLFWFARETPGGPDRTVLGPKPMRGIVRLGSAVSLPGAANVAANAQSVRTSANHVPFLRCLAEATYRLCANSRMRPSGRPEWTSMVASRMFHVSPRNYEICVSRYGLGEPHEKEFAVALARCSSLPCTVHFPALLSGVKVDEE